jgi:hypothetical protein
VAIAAVVVASLDDLQVIARYAINEAMFFGDSPRPGTGDSVFQRFWFTDPFMRGAADLGDEPIDPLEDRPVRWDGSILPAMRPARSWPLTVYGYAARRCRAVIPGLWWPESRTHAHSPKPGVDYTFSWYRCVWL